MPQFDADKGSIPISILLAVLIIGGAWRYTCILERNRAKTPSHPNAPKPTRKDKTSQDSGCCASWDRRSVLRFRKTMDRYYRSDPINLSHASVNRSVDDYNEWVRSEKEKSESEKAELDGELQSLRRIGAQ